MTEGLLALNRGLTCAKQASTLRRNNGDDKHSALRNRLRGTDYGPNHSLQCRVDDDRRRADARRQRLFGWQRRSRRGYRFRGRIRGGSFRPRQSRRPFWNGKRHPPRPVRLKWWLRPTHRARVSGHFKMLICARWIGARRSGRIGWHSARHLVHRCASPAERHTSNQADSHRFRDDKGRAKYIAGISADLVSSKPSHCTCSE